MGHMEVVTRSSGAGDTRTMSAVLAHCDEPGATVVGVSRRLSISAILIHGWLTSRWDELMPWNWMAEPAKLAA